MYTILKQADIKELREQIHKEQNEICPICKEKIHYSKTTLDHQHKKKDEEIGHLGKGLIRGVICFTCNSAEGRILGVYTRQGLHKKDIEYTSWLRNLADYLDREKLPYVHPTEVPKEPNIKKSLYNKLKKEYLKTDRKKKFPDFPKSGKITKALKELSEEFDISLF